MENIRSAPEATLGLTFEDQQNDSPDDIVQPGKKRKDGRLSMSKTEDTPTNGDSNPDTDDFDSVMARLKLLRPNMTEEDMEGVSQLLNPGVENSDTEYQIGMEDSVKPLYEGPAKCRCCINWVEEYPDNLKESLLGTREIQKHAIVTKIKRSHEGNEPVTLDSIEIQSPLLRTALKAVFEGYSGITTGLNKLSFSAPFQAFFHRLERLKEASEKQETDDPKALVHVKLLYNIVNNELRESVDIFNDLVSNRVITYKFLWALFTPGELIKVGENRLCRLEDSGYDTSDTEPHFKLLLKYIDWNGTEFGYGSAYVKIKPFDGTKPIEDLAGFPAQYASRIDSLKIDLVTRGKKFECLRGFHYKAYSGLMHRAGYKVGGWVFGDTDRNMDGRIVIDAESFFRFNTHKALDFEPLDSMESENTGVSSMISESARQKGSHRLDDDHMRTEKWSSRMRRDSLLDASDNPQDVRCLTDDELILCTNYVRGYSLKTKEWAMFDIAHIIDIQWNGNAFESLVLPPSHKELILSFVKGQIDHKDDFDDIIEGKGQGIVILLAGVPGVGKTLTAESVAEHLRAPLYSMTAGELGTSADSVEESLSDILELCTKWNAILLLDEADVFLEKRTSDHLERNKLVSIFLRMLEYYRGILFLTTNRISAFDSAFQSRIHITINYPGLSSTARAQIWRSFLYPKLSTTHPDAKIQQRPDHHQGDESNESAQQVTPMKTSIPEAEVSVLAELELNGRQIKNIVKTGRLLARSLAKELSIDEIRTVLEVMNASAQPGEGPVDD